MKKFAAFAFAVAAGILMLAGPSANAAPAGMCATSGLKAAAGTTVDSIRCRRYWRCHRGHCHWWRNCW